MRYMEPLDASMEGMRNNHQEAVGGHKEKSLDPSDFSLPRLIFAEQVQVCHTDTLTVDNFALSCQAGACVRAPHVRWNGS